MKIKTTAINYEEIHKSISHRGAGTLLPAKLYSAIIIAPANKI